MKGRRENNKNKRRSSNQNPTASQKKPKYYGDRNPDPIPVDLKIDIFSRLPVKTLVRFTCVSKIWSSIIRSPEFVSLFSIRSSTQPRLLTTFADYDHIKLQFFSSPHPKNPKEISSSVANHDLTVHGFDYLYVSKSLNGLIYAQSSSVQKICNPTTKQFITLPTPVTETPSPSGYCRNVTNFFAYDPIDDQHKVLNTTFFENFDEKKVVMEHQIFVLGENAWRRIQSGPAHYSATDNLCINGIVYYGAWTDIDKFVGCIKIVAFDVKHEKFKFINIPADSGQDGFFFHHNLALIDFGGKLALVDYQNLNQVNTINVWVLEDEIKNEWSRKNYVLPSFWRDYINGTHPDDQPAEDLNEVEPDREFYLLGTINTGEIIFAPWSLSERFFVVYYNMKTNSLRRVEIEGMPNHKFKHGHGRRNSCTFLSLSDHVESIKLLDGFNQ